MKAVKRASQHFLYGIASFICSVSTVALVWVLLLKEAGQPEIEPGLFDIPSPELMLLIFICPIVHAAGFFLGLAGFWLQPNTNGIGFWAMTLSMLLLLFDFLVWFRWTS